MSLKHFNSCEHRNVGRRTKCPNGRKQVGDLCQNSALELFDHAERSHRGGGGAPVCIVGVLATFQEVLVPAVVGLLVEDPRPVHHHAGVELPQLEGLVDGRAVFNALRRLTSKLLLVVESDLPGLSIHLQIVTWEK